MTPRVSHPQRIVALLALVACSDAAGNDDATETAAGRWSLTSAAFSVPPVVATWDLELRVDGFGLTGEVHDSRIGGVYQGEGAISQTSVRGDSIFFTFGQQFRARVRGASMTGAVRMGDFGEVVFTASRR